MVSIPQRMRRLQTRLLAIRLGSGAAVLPKEVNRIHLRFAPRMDGGHMGPRKFWRNELVRLKYHNPTVSMTIDRSAEQVDPAVMSIHFTAGNAPQTSNKVTDSSAPAEAERVEKINMKGYTNVEIMAALMRVTKAYPVEPTPEENEELERLEMMRRQSERDSKLSLEVRAKVKREQDLLKQASGDVAAQTA